MEQTVKLSDLVTVATDGIVNVDALGIDWTGELQVVATLEVGTEHTGVAGDVEGVWAVVATQSDGTRETVAEFTGLARAQAFALGILVSRSPLGGGA